MLDVLARRVEEWLHPASGPRPHAAEPPETRTAREMEEHGLELVVGGVCGRDRGGTAAARSGEQEATAEAAQGFLARHAPRPQALPADARRGERHAEIGAEGGNGAGVRVGGLTAHTVVEVCRVEQEVELARDRAKSREQRGRVGPAAHRNEQRRAGGQAEFPQRAAEDGFHATETGSDAGLGHETGGGGGTRTPDTGIMIPLLYQLSYTAKREAVRAVNTRGGEPAKLGADPWRVKIGRGPASRQAEENARRARAVVVGGK